MHAQQHYWLAGGIALAIALFAGLADWRRLRRKRIDDYGWVPWRGIQVTAMFAAIIALILAMKQG
jgi:hypothetical protein